MLEEVERDRVKDNIDRGIHRWRFIDWLRPGKRATVTVEVSAELVRRQVAEVVVPAVSVELVVEAEGYARGI